MSDQAPADDAPILSVNQTNPYVVALRLVAEATVRLRDARHQFMLAEEEVRQAETHLGIVSKNFIARVVPGGENPRPDEAEGDVS